MSLFTFEDRTVQELWDKLYYALDGTEPCFDIALVSPGPHMGDSPTDQYVEGWSKGNSSRRQARELCEGCHVIEQCAAYAIAAKEENGIWGGLRPQDRGIDVSKKRKVN